MDNITHSLIGVTLGHCVIRAVPKLSERPQSRKLVYWVSILANNAPDVDVFFSRFMGGGRLDSLLEHRGYTHTFLAIPILAFLSLGLGWILSGRPKLSRKSGLGFYFLGMLGVLCHLAADFCNDYGIHPFSPWVNRWYYGDSIFILEPLIWFAILPLAFQVSKARPLRGILLLIAAGMTGLLFLGSYVPLGVACFAVLWGGVAWLWQRKLGKGKWSWVPSVSLVALVLVAFVSASKRVRGDVSEVLAKQAPEEELIQLIRSPSPADPICWRILVVTEGPGDRYAIKAATLSLFPKLLSAKSCLRSLDSGHTLVLNPILFPSSTASGAEIQWRGEYTASRSELNRLSSQFCQMKALRRFARAPFWANWGSLTMRRGWVAGDMRFDRSSLRGAAASNTAGARNAGGFTGIHFGGSSDAPGADPGADRDTPCPKYLPGWDPPVPD